MHNACTNMPGEHAKPQASKNTLSRKIGVIELRNYVTKPGLRDSFIHYFEENFVQSQESLGGFLLGRYRIKGEEDHFCWIRGFENMQSRSQFLPSFYNGTFWKEHRSVANSMLANNDNVYLLRPMVLQQDSLKPVPYVDSRSLLPRPGIAVIRLYIANTKLPKLMTLFAKEYLSLLRECGFRDYSIWTSEMEPNTFPQLPVFQDPNLMVLISFFPNESEYNTVMHLIEKRLPPNLLLELNDTITLSSTWYLYPTAKSLNSFPK
ncbi:MAG: hypothetical protein ACJ75B_08280 [Flavisolibacter sp.]